MTIEELFELAVNSTQNEHYLLDWGAVTDELAARIRSETGVEIAGFRLSIDNYSIKHTLERHGNTTLEMQHGQVAVRKEDFALIPIIVLEADCVRFSPRQKNSQSPIIETLIFEKQIGDFYYVLHEIRRVSKKGKVNRLILQTMYCTKKRRTF